MAVIAQWLNKTWEVNPKKILALEGMTTSYKLRAETKDDAEGKPSTNVRGLELQPLSFDTVLSDAVGVDVLAEIESWGGLVSESAPFFLAGRRFGPDKLQLTDVNVTDMIVDDFGRIRQAKVKLKFQEYSGEAANKKSSTSNTKSNKLSPGIASDSTYAAMGLTGSSTTSSAASISATTEDKANKRPRNLMMPE